MSNLPVEQLHSLRDEALAAIGAADTAESLEEVERTYLGKKGSIRKQMSMLGKLPAEERPGFGKAVNEVSNIVQAAFDERLAGLQAARREMIRSAKRCTVSFTPRSP